MSTFRQTTDHFPDRNKGFVLYGICSLFFFILRLYGIHGDVIVMQRQYININMIFPSLIDGLARTVSIKRGKNCRNDSGREAAEALAKSARKNELMLSTSGIVKSNKSSNFASVCSKRGQKGINQDCAIVWEVRTIQLN